MASLFLPPLHAPAKANSSKSIRPVLAKPSHFITRANRSNDHSQGRVDRRNMLLGLGGMYGAANLAPTLGASADPILAPEIDKCSKPKNANAGGAILDINCCPPFSDKIIDYKLPPVTEMRTRPSAHTVSAEYIFKYNMATDLMKCLPKDDPRNFMQQANIHCAYCNGVYDQVGKGTTDLQIHDSWLFFPFHRWYLYFYERILGKLIDDPTFALPFWNWDNPKGMTVPPMFRDPKAAIYDTKRNQAHMAPSSIVNLLLPVEGVEASTDPLQIVSNNLSIIYTEMIRGNSTAIDFMGKQVGTARGAGACERGSHTAIHAWMGDTKDREPSGEDMGNFYSAGRDPLFYCHHANVDRMWTLWQYFLPSEKVPDKRITSPDFLESEFLFYDENAQLCRVKVKDSLDNLSMGFDYERIDLPWLNNRPRPQNKDAKAKRAAIKAPTVDKLVFPLKLNKITKVQVPKTKKGNVPELLVIEDITVITTKVLKFDVFVNDEDDDGKFNELDKASYAGSYAQLPFKSRTGTLTGTISLKLTDLYKDMNVDGDDTVVVTLVPRHQGDGVTIGGIKIIPEPPAPKKA